MIKVLSYKEERKGSVIGYVDILDSESKWIVRKIAHLDKEGRQWFNFPQYSEFTNTGERKYIRYCEKSEFELNQDFMDELHDAVKAYLDKQPIPLYKPEMF